jgi:hypothetical protein
MEQDKKYWFPARQPGYGWGWGAPIRWQGWVVWLAFVVLLLGGAIMLPPSLGGIGIALWGCLLGGLLMAICWWKGEPPGPPFGRGGPPRR